ncbi:MAG: hypothetical protein EPN84_02635 [Legionella sp.]|nr:MAG: hypothetical protein EPN84_02635 [Legionella sp.]
MSELFEEDEVVEIVEDFDEVDVEKEVSDTANTGLDARRRLESMLDDKRLRDELDDFVDY